MPTMATRPTDPDAARLRSRPPRARLHIVLVEPEIPPNTGNIARLAAATASPLHLIRPLGFRIDEQAVRRAGLDYWPLVDLRAYDDFDAFLDAYRAEEPNGRLVLFSARAKSSYLKTPFRSGDALVFGKESVGLPAALVDRFSEYVVGIPTRGAVRSLNLSNAVSIGVYEALRQLGELDETTFG